MLTSCASCRRHVRRSERMCPFCGAEMRPGTRASTAVAVALAGSIALLAPRTAHAETGVGDAGGEETSAGDAALDTGPDAMELPDGGDYGSDVAAYGCASAPAGASAPFASSLSLLGLAALRRRRGG